jgi:cyanoexosortase A
MNQLKCFKGISSLPTSFGLLFLSGGLVTIHLTLAWRTESPNLQVISLVFWLTAAYRIWSRRSQLMLKSGVGASLLGSILLSLLLLKSTAVGDEYFLHIYPFVAGFSLALLASDFKGLGQYWRELVLLFFLGIPAVGLPLLLDPSLLTAQFSSILLWYFGFAVTRQGVNLMLPGGSIEVNLGCSGLELIAQLLSLSVWFLTLFPLQWHWVWKLSFPLIGVAISFIVNGVRVALLAVLVAQGQTSAFEYWHSGQGSLAFSWVAILLFVLVVKGFIHLDDKDLLKQEELAVR